MLSPSPYPDFNPRATLHFLDSGQYLFQSRKPDGGMISKFVTSADVHAAFSQVSIDSGWMAPGVVRCGTNVKGQWFVYSAPAQKVDITLEGDIQPITCPIPRTLLIGAGGIYYLWALKEKHFDPNALPWQAPFPNVHPHGKICWGTNTPPAIKPENARKAWDLFFTSPFNADLAGAKSRLNPDDVRNTLRRLADERKREYPLGDLESPGHVIPVQRVLSEILEGHYAH